MSFLDKAKRAFDSARGRAGELAEQHGDKIESAIDKGGEFVDRRTHGKYTDTDGKVGSKAKDATDKLAAQSSADGEAPSSASQSPTHEADRSADPVPAPEPVDPPEPIDPAGHEGPGRPGS